MYKVKFSFEFKDKDIQVFAMCSDIDSYGEDNLKFEFEGPEDLVQSLQLNELAMDELKEEAHENLYNEKFGKELDFAD
jgi:hypothetical protein